MENNTIKLTEFTKGGGCGCKIPPQELKELLKGVNAVNTEQLLVGNSSSDDAAVYVLNEDLCLISTTDFFTPIVDSPYDFGRIAAANAISDVYAMGGKPILALSILGWPSSKLPIAIATEVLKGATETCRLAGISLAGGHSIENNEPIFGLAVNGIVSKNKIKKNNTAQAEDIIFITKAIGTGILSTAIKRGLESAHFSGILTESMCQLNFMGEKLAEFSSVSAMTDITGFGLLGHLIEMTDNGRISAVIKNKNIPLLTGTAELAKQWVYPDNTMRNWKMYGADVSGISGEMLLTLCDPQTNGGLLFSVHPDFKVEVCKFFETEKLPLFEIGKFEIKKEFSIIVE
jgi:selenide,water dikinase